MFICNRALRSLSRVWQAASEALGSRSLRDDQKAAFDQNLGDLGANGDGVAFGQRAGQGRQAVGVGART